MSFWNKIVKWFKKPELKQKQKKEIFAHENILMEDTLLKSWKMEVEIKTTCEAQMKGFVSNGRSTAYLPPVTMCPNKKYK